GLAANERDLRLVNLLKIQHILLGHRDTSAATACRCAALAENPPTSYPRFWSVPLSGRRFCGKTRVLPQAPRCAIC
ncbi:hypothetical protein AB0J84_08840, partial [Micromonospora arborensis]|uniref:hypothetical protein n=1 Tax=Micromonospora arborensis TaxID=2116518 RepID=UPI003420AE92